MKKLGFASNLLFALASVVAGSGVAISNAKAATFALSEADVVLFNFNQTPQTQDAFSITDTETTAILGEVTAATDANAIFSAQPVEAGNFTFSQVFGEGLVYSGEAISEARVVGNFFIPRHASNSSFSFDFVANLNLETSVDDPTIESASAIADIALLVFAGSNPDSLTLVDFFTVAGFLNAAKDGDFLKTDSSSSVIFNHKTLSPIFGGLQETATASFNASYQRTFNSGTYVTLVETKASVASAQAVPEPSTMLAALSASGLGVALKRRKRR